LKWDGPTIRTFICLEISDSLKTRIEAMQQQFRSLGGDVAWVKPGNIHLTLKFLGETAADQLILVQQCCTRVAQNFLSFAYEVGGAGCFPSRKNPRILWVGLQNIPESLRRVHSELELTLSKEGFPPDDRPFSPHLTIGRLRTPRNGERLSISWQEAGFRPEKLLALEIVLMKSELKTGGSIYTPLQRFPFQT
jgi:RNA 2',3'-cyclic 3'-phosphodiesterase